MKNALIGLALIVFASAGCSKPMTAQVSCQEHTQGFSCSVTAVGGEGKNYSVCWDILVSCGDGQKLTANNCQDIAGGGKSSSVVPNSKFSGGNCKVGKVSGIAVENVKITQK